MFSVVLIKRKTCTLYVLTVGMMCANDFTETNQLYDFGMMNMEN